MYALLKHLYMGGRVYGYMGKNNSQTHQPINPSTHQPIYKKFLTCLLLSLLFIGGVFAQTYTPYTPPPGSPLANHEHPRLYFTADMLPGIKAYIDGYESANFQTFINALDGAYGESAGSKDRNYLLLDANSYAFLYQATTSGLFGNYSFGHSAAEYGQKAWEHAAEISAQMMTDELHETSHAGLFGSSGQGGWVNLALGAIYDWCYDYLTLSQKQVIADAFISAFENRDSDTDPGEYTKLGLTITSQCHDVGVGGMAMWGDPLGSQYTDTVQEMLNGLQWLWFDRLYYMGDQLFENTTGWSEGPDYFGGATTTIFWYTAALSSAINTNLFQEIHWLHDIPKYLYFYVLPMSIDGESQGYYTQRNDACSNREWEGMGTLQQLTPPAHFLKNTDPEYAGFYRWIWEDSQYQFTSYAYENEDPRLYWLFYKFLWGSKDVTKKTPAQIGLQQTYRFGLGDLIMKSDHTTQDATKINFYTPMYHLPRHYHKDAGSFVIFKYGNLALDAGVAKSDNSLPKSDKSGYPIYHNILAIDAPGGDLYYSYDMDTETSADAYYDPENQPGGANNIGNMVALKVAPDRYDYADFDYTRAYKGEDYMNRIRRKMLYIRDPQAPNYANNEEYVVLFDDVDVTDANITRRWLLHTPVEPQIVGQSWQQAGSCFWTSNSGNTIEVTNTYGNSHGKLYVKFLEPTSYQLRLRGGNEGSDYRWFTDSEGNDLAERGPFSDWGAFWAGTHRLEVEDLSGGSTSQYLAVMQVGDANTLSAMVPVEKITTNNFVGALINGNRLALVNKTPNRVGSLSYSINTSQSVRHYLTGLLPGNYDVRKNGVSIATVPVDGQGVLYFEHSGGGSFELSGGVTGISGDEPVAEGFRLEQNYPNPFNPETVINYQLSVVSDVVLAVYNLLGEKVATLVNARQGAGQYQVQWNGRDQLGRQVSSGVYLYRLEAGGLVQSRKMILMR